VVTSPDKPPVWLHGVVKPPPFSKEARLEAGVLLREFQQGETLALPHSRPMPSIERHCPELRIEDQNQTWTIIYRIDPDAIVIAEGFRKKTRKPPLEVIDTSQQRLKAYDDVVRIRSR
jgi:phage-related protein